MTRVGPDDLNGKVASNSPEHLTPDVGPYQEAQDISNIVTNMMQYMKSRI